MSKIRTRQSKPPRRNKTSKKHNTSFNMKLNGILKELMQLQQQNKFFHWNTPSYSSHKVTDHFGEKLSDHIDTIVEIGLARKLRLSPVNKYFNNTPTITTKNALLKRVAALTYHVAVLSNHKDAPNDIKAILDAVMEDLNRFKYLFSMH